MTEATTDDGMTQEPTPDSYTARPTGPADAGPLAGLSAFQRDALATLAGMEARDDAPGRPPKGIEIRRSMETNLGAGVNHGRLYPNLDDLVERGLIEKGTLNQRANTYSLTEAGRGALAEHANWLAGGL